MSAICSDCGKTLGLPIRSGGNKYKCKACGGVTEVVAKPSTCSGCGVDVTNRDRMDAWGNHYCDQCWNATMQKTEAAKATRNVTSHHGASGAIVAAKDKVNLVKQPDSQGLSTAEKSVIAGGVVVVLLVIGFASYFLVFRDRWENQNRQTLLNLKSDAAVLVREGQITEAKSKYNELFQLLGDRKVRDASLQDEINTARNAANHVNERVAAKEMEKQEEVRRRQAETLAREQSQRAVERWHQEQERLSRERAAQAVQAHKSEIAETWLAIGKEESDQADFRQLYNAQKSNLDTLVSLGRATEVQEAADKASDTLNKISASASRSLVLLKKIQTFDNHESGQVAIEVLNDANTPTRYKPYIRKYLE